MVITKTPYYDDKILCHICSWDGRAKMFSTTLCSSCRLRGSIDVYMSRNEVREYNEAMEEKSCCDKEHGL